MHCQRAARAGWYLMQGKFWLDGNHDDSALAIRAQSSSTSRVIPNARQFWAWWQPWWQCLHYKGTVPLHQRQATKEQRGLQRVLQPVRQASCQGRIKSKIQGQSKKHRHFRNKIGSKSAYNVARPGIWLGRKWLFLGEFHWNSQAAFFK